MEILMLEILKQYVAQFPDWLITMFLVMGSFRVVMKPLVALVQLIVKETPTPEDDKFVAKVMESKTYKTVCFVLDWVVSLKLPQKKK